MTDKDKLKQSIDDGLLTVHHRPETRADRVHTQIEDTKNLFKQHKKLWVSLIGGFSFFMLLLLLQVGSIRLFASMILDIFFTLLSLFWKYFWPWSLLGIIPTLTIYRKVKSFIRKERFSFNEFEGSYEEIVYFREGENKVLLFRPRASYIETLLKGKEAVEIEYDTFNYLKQISETKTIKNFSEEINIQRITIMPRSELPGQNLFHPNPQTGKLSLNTNFLLDYRDVQEFLLKSTLPGVDAEKLKRQMFNLTKKLSDERSKRSEIEREAQEETDKAIWDHLIYNCPSNEKVVTNIRLLSRRALEDDTLPSSFIDSLEDHYRLLPSSLPRYAAETSEGDT